MFSAASGLPGSLVSLTTCRDQACPEASKPMSECFRNSDRCDRFVLVRLEKWSCCSSYDRSLLLRLCSCCPRLKISECFIDLPRISQFSWLYDLLTMIHSLIDRSVGSREGLPYAPPLQNGSRTCQNRYLLCAFVNATFPLCTTCVGTCTSTVLAERQNILSKCQSTKQPLQNAFRDICGHKYCTL